MADASVISRERTELYVGLFVVVGLAIMGTLIWNFSGLRHELRPRYPLYIVMPDANGVLEGGKVKFRGTEIGFVKTKQFKADLSGVLIALDIFAEYQIPENSQFTIVTSGLMGDRYIDIVPPEKLTSNFIQPNTPETAISNAGADLMTELKKRGAAIADRMERVLAELESTIKRSRDMVENLNSVTEKIDQQVLNEENIGNISKAIEKLRDTTTNLDVASKELQPLLTESQKTVEAAAKPFERAEQAIGKLEPALVDLREIIRQVRNGEGMAGAILTDPKVREDLTSFVDNLEKNGILGYKKGRVSEPQESGRNERPGTVEAPAKPEPKAETRPPFRKNR